MCGRGGDLEMGQIRARTGRAARGRTIAMSSVDRRMGHLSACGVAAEDGPLTVAALESVGHLHGGAFSLGLEHHLCLGSIAVDGDLPEAGVHGGEIDGTRLLKMLENSGTNGFLVRGGLAA